MESFSTIFRICTPCTREAPPRIAAATWTASVISAEVGPFLQAGARVGVDAVRALDRVRHPEGDQRLLPLRELPLLEHFGVVVEEFLPQLRRVLPDLAELLEIGRDRNTSPSIPSWFVIANHSSVDLLLLSDVSYVPEKPYRKARKFSGESSDYRHHPPVISRIAATISDGSIRTV